MEQIKPPTSNGNGDESTPPFLKWAGGKRWLAPRINDVVKSISGRYIEPFLGSGAIFFSLRPASSLLPYMHSESALVHTQATELFTRLGIQDNLNFELRHKAIIDRFGRYPHRNAILGRTSSAQELAFLAEPGSSF